MTTTTHQDPAGTRTTPVAQHAVIGIPQWAALASVLAGGIHLAVAPEHLEHWWVYGAFFIVIGGFQAIFAPVVLRRPTWPVALTGIAVNLGVVLIWVLSRTTGLPITPPADITSHGRSDGLEAVGAADLAATGAELLVVCLLVSLLPPRMRRITVNLLLVTAAGLWALRLSGALG